MTKINLKPRGTENDKGTPLHKYNVFLLVSTLLLLLLFTSAGILLYRISRIQSRYSLGYQVFIIQVIFVKMNIKNIVLFQDSLIAPNSEIYNEILHWQTQLHSKSAGAVNNFLDSNLDQIAKVCSNFCSNLSHIPCILTINPLK